MVRKKSSRVSKKRAAKAKAHDTHQGKRARVRTVNAVKRW
jgi:hypothetical protein